MFKHCVICSVSDINDEQTAVVEQTPRMFATEVSTRDPDNANTDLSVANQLRSQLDKINIGETSATTVADTNNRNNFVVNAANEQGEPEKDFAETDRSSRVGSPSKSVRFAESSEREGTDLSHTSKEMKQMLNENIAKQQNMDSTDDGNTDVNDADNKNRKNARVTCKDDSIEDIYKKDDKDDDDENSREKFTERNSAQNNKQTGYNNNQNSNNPESSEQKENSQNSQSGKQRNETQLQQQDLTSARVTRAKSLMSDRTVEKNSGRKKSENPKRPSSAKLAKQGLKGKGKCSRFDRSVASKSHTNTLEASAVLHGNSVVTLVGPESPKRRRGRLQSLEDRDSNFKSDGTFCLFPERTRPCFETEKKFDNFEIGFRSHKSKVKFLLEGEEPDLDTIFIEDDGGVNIRNDTEINFEVLDSELALLRTHIRNALDENTTANENEGIKEHKEADVIIESESDSDEKIPDDNDDGDEHENTDNTDEQVPDNKDTIDTIRGDYSSILEKYRQRCMERSEVCGAISTMLVTPRDTQSFISSQSVTSENQADTNISKDLDKKKSGSMKTAVRSTVTSDSGHGSVENLSEFSRSRSASVTLTPVPRLDLGDCSSDLGIDTGRSEKTVTPEATQEVEVIDEEHSGEKNLLELVCEQLSPLEKVSQLSFFNKF